MSLPPSPCDQPQSEESFKRYIHKIVKTNLVCGTGISQNAVSIINTMVNDIAKRIAIEASEILKKTNKKTLTEHEIQAAVQLVLGGDLAHDAMCAAQKAIQNYHCNK